MYVCYWYLWIPLFIWEQIALLYYILWLLISQGFSLWLTMYGRYTVCPQTIIFNLSIRVLIQDEHILYLFFTFFSSNQEMKMIFLMIFTLQHPSSNQSTTQRSVRNGQLEIHNEAIMKIFTTERCYNIAFTCMHITCSSWDFMMFNLKFNMVYFMGNWLTDLMAVMKVNCKGIDITIVTIKDELLIFVISYWLVSCWQHSEYYESLIGEGNL